jgi:competence protein ComEA
MKDRIKDYFAFNRKEQRGLIILLGLLLLSVSINLLLPRIIPEKEYDISPFQKEVDAFLASVEIPDSVKDFNPKKFYEKSKEDKIIDLSPFIASPFYFDPNNLTEQQWEKMGMNEKIIRNILHYREKGGTFYNKEGFAKIYGMNDSIFSILEPYIRFDEKVKNNSSSFTKYVDKDSAKTGNKYANSKSEVVVIELNSTDSVSLLTCRGIGPTYASRIIRYRDRLGGFTNAKQLMEIKGLDSARFDQFKDQVIVNPQLVRKIDLNAVTFKELMKHPYFEYYLVKEIFNYKDEIREWDSVGQLKKIPVMYTELFEKIAPYLEVKEIQNKKFKTNSIR